MLDPGGRVEDDVDLYRLVNPDGGAVWDDDENRWKVSSAAFQNTSKTDRMSVVLGDTLDRMGRPPEDARATRPEWYVVALRAGFVRSEQQEIERAPMPEERAHGNVIGEKRKACRRALAQAARWIVPPPSPP